MCRVRLKSAPLLKLWRHHGVRCLGFCVFFNSIGMVGEQVALGWYILEITDSAFMVGIALGVRNLPLLLAGIPAGVVADRGDRVKLLQVSGVTMAVGTALFGVLVAMKLGGVGPALMLTFLTGCARALHQTARQGYAHDTAGGGGVVHALALVALTSRLGGLLGSLMAGYLIAHFGSATAYLVVAASYLVSAVAMLPARASGRPGEATGSTMRDDVFGFLGTIRRDRMLLHLMSLTAIAEVLGFSHQALLPSLARDVLQVGPEGLGVMTAARQVGGLAGIAFTSGLGGARGYGPVFLSVLIGFGAALVALGFAPSFGVVLLILVCANALGAVTDVLAQTLIQLAVPSGLRGRAGGAWVVSIGMAPLGQFQVGALASLFGVGAALGLNGVALMAVGAAAALLVPRLRRL
jgi:Transmembrane secretion effector